MVDPLLGIIEAETGGNAVRYPDVMQSSESQGMHRIRSQILIRALKSA